MAKRIEFSAAAERARAAVRHDMRRPTIEKLDEIAARSPRDREALETMIDEVLRRLDAHDQSHAG